VLVIADADIAIVSPTATPVAAIGPRGTLNTGQ
jgi:hypothetical protein